MAEYKSSRDVEWKSTDSGEVLSSWNRQFVVQDLESCLEYEIRLKVARGDDVRDKNPLFLGTIKTIDQDKVKLRVRATYVAQTNGKY